ncbi:TetR/AcrR family transcriptional regulator [Paractinoplanes lichenicola]|uniref:TetR/AcrR family transcriptional regulator n=1 Tax=Paractinoplanes lichenicola TaxID=2802976 RepID=A0ABS1VUT2_9ACTN|nr:TetR/AcrR family transcriptional regulator [Actinoplanes lichenicola]MBL7258245.1 TetR/AcrR family transcriptional regulator [Actinoplanes lichenicola]
MPRPTKQQIDDEILETAATLFARHGFKETSIQRIADAVGYSKTGLLHRYPTKEALQQAVVDHALRDIREVAAAVRDLPPGPGRDRAAVAGIARLALEGRGTVALLLSGLVSEPESELGCILETIGDVIFECFATDPETDPIRAVRVVGALGALAVVGVTLQAKPLVVTLDDLIDVSYDALGHGRAASA